MFKEIQKWFIEQAQLSRQHENIIEFYVNKLLLLFDGSPWNIGFHMLQLVMVVLAFVILCNLFKFGRYFYNRWIDSKYWFKTIKRSNVLVRFVVWLQTKILEWENSLLVSTEKTFMTRVISGVLGLSFTCFIIVFATTHNEYEVSISFCFVPITLFIVCLSGKIHWLFNTFYGFVVSMFFFGWGFVIIFSYLSTGGGVLVSNNRTVAVIFIGVFLAWTMNLLITHIRIAATMQVIIGLVISLLSVFVKGTESQQLYIICFACYILSLIPLFVKQNQFLINRQYKKWLTMIVLQNNVSSPLLEILEIHTEDAWTVSKPKVKKYTKKPKQKKDRKVPSNILQLTAWYLIDWMGAKITTTTINEPMLIMIIKPFNKYIPNLFKAFIFDTDTYCLAKIVDKEFLNNTQNEILSSNTLVSANNTIIKTAVDTQTSKQEIVALLDDIHILP